MLSFILSLLLNFYSIENDFFSYKLIDIHNNQVSFSEFKRNKATVIIFLLSDCPASQSYTVTLNKLAKKFSNEKIEFIGIFPGRYSTDNEIQKFQKQYKITFPLLKDADMFVAEKLNATVGPSCFLINGDGKIVYEGRIDDWLYALGKKRQMVTENNLQDAIEAVIKNIPVKIKKTNPIGCILEYEK